MNRLIVFIILVLLFNIGCSKEPLQHEVGDPADATADSTESTEAETEIEDEIIELLVFTEATEFIHRNYATLLDGWIYYSDKKSNDLRRCRPDLTEDSLVFSSSFGSAFIMNPDGYSIQGIMLRFGRAYEGHPEYVPSLAEYYIYNVHEGTIEKTGLPDSDTILRFRGITVYRDNIFLNNSSLGIEMYTRDGNFIKSVYENEFFENDFYYGGLIDFAIVDNDVYYLVTYIADETLVASYENVDVVERTYNNVVLRYDIDDESTEKLFETAVEVVQGNVEGYTPKVFFNNRNIIVQTDIVQEKQIASFVYFDIDSIEPQEVVFDFGELREPGALEYRLEYIYSDDDLYFKVGCVLGGGEYNPIQRTFYYKLTQGETKPVLLKEFECSHPVYVSNGYLYYYDDNNKLCRELLH